MLKKRYRPEEIIAKLGTVEDFQRPVAKELGIQIPFPQRDLHLRSVDSPIPVRNMQ